MGCPDRSPECHGRCERYKAFQEEKRKEYALKVEENEKNTPTDSKTRGLRRALVRKGRYGR